MKNILIFIVVLLIGCTQSWRYSALEDIAKQEITLSAQECQTCHQQEYATWARTYHANSKRMQQIPVVQLRECAACHDNLTAHTESPAEYRPADIADFSKTDQNAVCGKCHYNYDMLGRKAINPHNRHGLLMSVGFEDKKRQITCLNCHSGHSEKSDMLRRIRAHICFTCHKEAIMTMGVFQPLNYLGMGKVCLGCHPTHGGSRVNQATRMTVGVGATCFVCHPTLEFD